MCPCCICLFSLCCVALDHHLLCSRFVPLNKYDFVLCSASHTADGHHSGFGQNPRYRICRHPRVLAPVSLLPADAPGDDFAPEDRPDEAEEEEEHSQPKKRHRKTVKTAVKTVAADTPGDGDRIARAVPHVALGASLGLGARGGGGGGMQSTALVCVSSSVAAIPAYVQCHIH